MEEKQLHKLLKLKENYEMEEKNISKEIDISMESKRYFESNKEKFIDYDEVMKIINNNINENIQKKEDIQKRKKYIEYQILMIQNSRKAIALREEKVRRIKAKKINNTKNVVAKIKNSKKAHVIKNVKESIKKENKKTASGMIKNTGYIQKNNLMKKIGYIEGINIKQTEEKAKKSEKLEHLKTTVQTRKSVYEQAYDDMIKRNGTLREWFESVIKYNENIDNIINKSSSNKEKNKLNQKNNKNNTNQVANKLLINRIILKEYCNKGLEEKIIKINEKKIKFTRKLDKNTEKEINEMCKKILKIDEKFSIKKIIAMHILKSKIDPAIVNSIKEYLMPNLKQWNEDIQKYVNMKKVRGDIGTEKLKKAHITAINAENAKIQPEREYKKLLEQYIRALELKEKTKLPFDIIYDCSGEMSISKYNNISSYIKKAEKAGAKILGKRSFFGILKEKVDESIAIEKIIVPKYKEGDKSFVAKVNPVAIPVVVERQTRVKQKQMLM